MSRAGALAVRTPGVTAVSGTAEPTGTTLLRAPASGTPCVHWRLRIVEQVAPGLELVHEMVSSDAIDLCWQPDPALPPQRVRVAPNDARLEAQPVLFREGSPGAVAVGREFGFRGRLQVHEVIIRPGEAVDAEGVLVDPGAALSRGASRTMDMPVELMAPVLRVGATLSLRPVILPWALGTAAALLGTMGVGAALYHYLDLAAKRPANVLVPAEVGAKRIIRSLWP